MVASVTECFQRISNQPHVPLKKETSRPLHDKLLLSDPGTCRLPFDACLLNKTKLLQHLLEFRGSRIRFIKAFLLLVKLWRSLTNKTSRIASIKFHSEKTKQPMRKAFCWRFTIINYCWYFGRLGSMATTFCSITRTEQDFKQEIHGLQHVYTYFVFKA
jgi:hypothetical protein